MQEPDLIKSNDKSALCGECYYSTAKAALKRGRKCIIFKLLINLFRWFRQPLR